MGKWTKKQWRGHTFNKRTIRMLKKVEKRSGVTLNIAQGGWANGRVSASGSTHDGSAVDIGMWGMSKKDRIKVIHAAKQVGFGGWIRKPSQGFSWHFHGLPFGDPHVSLSGMAQLRSYEKGRNGLTNNAPDDTWRPPRKKRWGWKRNRPVRRR